MAADPDGRITLGAVQAPAATVTRHESALGRWETVRRAAPPALRPHVLGYLGYREWLPRPFRRLEVPSDEVHVIVSFGPRVRVPAPVRSFVAAPHSEHTIVDFDAEQHGIEIRLTPIGAHLILRLPMHELADRVTPIDDVLGRAGDELPERLYEGRHMAGAARAARPPDRGATPRGDPAGAGRRVRLVAARALARRRAGRGARKRGRLEPSPPARALPR